MGSYGSDIGRAHAIHMSFQGGKVAGAEERDKWWVDNMRSIFVSCCEFTCPAMTPDCKFLNDACMAWQQLKKSIEEGE